MTYRITGICCDYRTYRIGEIAENCDLRSNLSLKFTSFIRAIHILPPIGESLSVIGVLGLKSGMTDSDSTVPSDWNFLSTDFANDFSKISLAADGKNAAQH